MQEKGTVHISSRSDPAQVNKSLRQDLDVLSKNQTGSHTYKHNKSPAGKLASTKKVVWPTALF